MRDSDLAERRWSAARLRAIRVRAADDVAAFFEQQVALGLYDDETVRGALKDIGFQMDCLAAAIESGSMSAFAEYAAWAHQTLHARGVSPRFLADSLVQMKQSITKHAPETAAMAAVYLDAASSLRAMPHKQGGATEGVLEKLKTAFLEAILAGNRHTAAMVLSSALQAGHPALDLYTEVVQEALYEVGRRWQSNHITVADEHRATAITQFVLAQFYPLIPAAPQSRGKVVIAGVQGELHQIGSLLIADALESDGWDVVFLGANTPAESIAQAVEAHQPSVLGLSVTMLFNLPFLLESVDLARSSQSSIRIVGGGAAVQMAPQLCRELRLDGWPRDVRAAITLFRELETQVSAIVGRA
jgi:methanogenic corrinoid protein MtbC1